MAGLAERYWWDLRPSAAGRYRLDVGARHGHEATGREGTARDGTGRDGTGREGTGRDLRRPRRQVRPALRARSR
jgi:hypothetical protein